MSAQERQRLEEATTKKRPENVKNQSLTLPTAASSGTGPHAGSAPCYGFGFYTAWQRDRELDPAAVARAKNNGGGKGGGGCTGVFRGGGWRRTYARVEG